MHVETTEDRWYKYYHYKHDAKIGVHALHKILELDFINHPKLQHFCCSFGRFGIFLTAVPLSEGCSFRAAGTFVSFWNPKIFLHKIALFKGVESVGIQWIFTYKYPVDWYFSSIELSNITLNIPILIYISK